MNSTWEVLRQQALEAHPFPELPSSLDLPALPGVVTAFMERSNDPEATAQELGALIETDSGLTCEILKLVNSARFQSRRSVSRPGDAIAMLGLRQAKNFVMVAGAKAAMVAADTKVINQESFWNEALQRALFAREVAVTAKLDATASFAGSLLQDFLLPVLTRASPEAYFEFLRETGQTPISLCAYEQRVFGYDHAQAAACVANQWNLPDEIICCILYHHDVVAILSHPDLEDSACLPIALSAMLPGQLKQVVEGRQRLVELDRSASAYDLLSVCQTVDEEHAALASNSRTKFPLVRQFEPLIKRAALAT